MQLYRIVTCLGKDKFDPFVISMMNKGPVGEMLSKKGITVYELGMKKGSPEPRAVLKLHKIIKKESPIILTTFLFHSNVLGRIIGRFNKIPIIVSSIRNIYFGGYKREKIIKYTNNLCDITTINSETAADRMAKDLVIPLDKMKVMPNGLDTKRYAPSAGLRRELRLEKGLTEDVFLWVSIGRLHRQKNYPKLLYTFYNVLKLHPKTMLFIAGNGPLEVQCKQLVVKLGIEKNVRFLGVIKDVFKLLNIADAYVMSSSWEGMPNSIMEAVATNLPIVATNVGGIPELIKNNKTGFLVSPDSENELIEKMLKMMSLSSDERNKMGQLGRKHIVDNYDIYNIVKQWEELYMSLIENKNLD